MSRRLLTHWLPLLLWMVVIFGASTGLGSPEHTSRFIRPFLVWLDPGISEKTIERIHHGVRKTAHAVEYAVLGVLIWRVVRVTAVFAAHQVAGPFRPALLLAALYAATDEMHQFFVPGREAAVSDVLLDTCGAGAGLALAWLITRKRQTP